MSLVVVSPGIAGSRVDRGRPGLAGLGAPRGGAVDLAAFDLGNRLLGNPRSAGGYECSGHAVLRTTRRMVVALTGAEGDVQTSTGGVVGWGQPTVIPEGCEIRIGRLRHGARMYLAVRGGLLAPHEGVLDLGPEPLEGMPGHSAPPVSLDREVRLHHGPRLDWFGPDTWTRLVRSEFSVTDTSRVGVRLSGPPLLRSHAGELPSEGLVEGAVQVPPDGQPIVMLADHPTTGGYPVVAVVDPADLSLVAQAAAGTTVSFRPARG